MTEGNKPMEREETPAKQRDCGSHAWARRTHRRTRYFAAGRCVAESLDTETAVACILCGIEVTTDGE